MDETQDAIDQALEGGPRADELSAMVAALEVRRETFARERDAATDEAGRKEWGQRIREVDKQIKVLRQEMAITEFVEKSVRVTVNRPRLDIDEEGF
jgi:outer membrane murein-binding lipoprotein Lpp